jgi:hypothetical protein
MSGFFLLDRFPSRGRQFGDPGDGPIAQLGQDVVEVLAPVNVQTTAGLHDRGDGGDFRSGLRTVVQPIKEVSRTVTMLRTCWRGLARFGFRRQSGSRFDARSGILQW